MDNDVEAEAAVEEAKDEPPFTSADNDEEDNVDEEEEQQKMSMGHFSILSGNVIIAKSTPLPPAVAADGKKKKASSASASANVSAVCPIITGSSEFATVIVDKCNIPSSSRGTTSSTTTSTCCYYYEAELQSDGLMQIGWADGEFSTANSSGNSNSKSNSSSGSSSAGVEDADATTVPVGADGVGDDSEGHSWGYDGYRQQKWHRGVGAPYGPQTGTIWRAGDVIGCMLELFGGASVSGGGTGCGASADVAAPGPTAAGSAAKKRKSSAAAPKQSTHQQVEVEVGRISYTVNGESFGAGFSLYAAAITAATAATATSYYPSVSLEDQESVVLNLGNAPFKFPPPNSRSSGAGGSSKGSGSSSSVVDSSNAGVECVCVSVYETIVTSSSFATSASSISATAEADNIQISATATTATASAAEPAARVVYPEIALESDEYASGPGALAALGLAHLKQELERRGLKVGGTLQERAERLHSVRGLAPDKIDPKLLVKKK